MDFWEACRGKTLEEIWSSPEVKEVKASLRKELQEMVNDWASRDHKRHIPVYISLKPKVKLRGLYYPKPRGGGSIVIFPIEIDGVPAKQVRVRSRQEILETLKHEYAHHLSRDIPHGPDFWRNYRKVARR